MDVVPLRTSGLSLVMVPTGRETFRYCHGPSVPVKHPGRRRRASRPARHTAARRNKAGHPGKRHTGHKRRAPVGMTEEEIGENPPC
jgi:hypothetical protein